MDDEACDHEHPTVSDGGKSLISRIFGALSNQRRRYVLYYVREHQQAQTDDLAVQIVAWEQDISKADVSEADAETVATDLVHSHLPKLDDYGLVEYDRRSGAVSYSHPPSLLDDAIELTASIETPP